MQADDAYTARIPCPRQEAAIIMKKLGHGYLSKYCRLCIHILATHLKTHSEPINPTVLQTTLTTALSSLHNHE